MEKPVDIRGFGFKLEGGRTQNRPIFISTIEEGFNIEIFLFNLIHFIFFRLVLLIKLGLCIDDEVISMNDENIENMTFDQVRKNS